MSWADWESMVVTTSDWDDWGTSPRNLRKNCVCECSRGSGYCECEHDHHHRTERQHRQDFTAALDNGQMIEVCVGSGDNFRVFSVYETLLRSSSAFFKKALNGDWKEAKKRKVELPAEDPMIFDIYHKWLLLNEILIGSQGRSPLEAANDSEVEYWDKTQFQSESEPELSSAIVFNILLECYVLGDHLLDSMLKNAVIENSIRLVDANYYPVEWISVLPKKLPKSAGLVHLFRDIWVDRSCGHWIEKSLPDNMDATTAFLMSLTKTALDSRTSPDLRRWSEKNCHCRYYDNICKDLPVSQLGDW